MIANAQINPPGPFSGKDPFDSIGDIVGLSFQIILIVAAIYAVLQIIFAGYSMISSGGDKQGLESARGKIIWAIVGLIIVMASWGLIVLVEQWFGVGLGFSKPINLGIQ